MILLSEKQPLEGGTRIYSAGHDQHGLGLSSGRTAQHSSTLTRGTLSLGSLGLQYGVLLQQPSK